MIPRSGYNIETVEQAQQIKAISIFLKDVYSILNHNIIPTDNFRGTLLNVTFSALNTNTSIAHGLDYVPSNYFVVGLSADMRIYDGSIANNRNYVNFRCAGTTGAARLFVF